MSNGIYKSGIALLAVLSLLVVMSGIAMGMGGTPGFPQVSIQGQEAVLSPAMRGMASVFMKIENSGNADDKLVGAKTSIPGAVAELHDVKDGRMSKAESIKIPSRSTVELKPKGLHIMLFKMPKDTREGSEFTLTLRFEKSGEKKIPVKFVKAMDDMMRRHNH